ncbi:Lipoprotein-releasing system ATP-binding protein LolD [Ruminococcaceae bacterium BL-4]|nr:Lipoprotein-releasing system ATP-binding protein LolD [Ruminococcaceae bacterium BL-4]
MQQIKTTDTKTILSVSDLSKNYANGKETVLKDISLAVKQGEFIVIHGESGSGKSTLLHLLAGFDRADSGEILYGQTDICKMNESERARFRRDNIGFVFQQFHLLPELTALENVMMPLLIRKEKVGNAREKAEQFLFYVGLEDRMDHTPEQLSGGQNQRVAIARALIGNAAMIFADEPTGNLDSKNRGEILDLLKKINREKATAIMMVTHSIEERGIADRVIELKDGVIV